MTKLIGALEVALDQKVYSDDFVPLEKTDQLREAFFKMITENEGNTRITWSGDKTIEVMRIISEIRCPGAKVVVFHQYDKFTGALIVDPKAVLSHVQDIWPIVDQDLSLCTETLDDGFCLEFNHYGNHDEYELTTWGFFSPRRKNGVC